jgi:hypothetical protein
MKALTKTSHEHRARPVDYSVYVRTPSAWDRVRAGLVLSLSAVAGFWIVRLVIWWVGMQAGR